MFTARAQEADKELSESVRADGYLNKPFNATELIGKVKELLDEA